MLGEHDDQGEVDAEDREPARDARALEHDDERVEQQRDERGDDEDQRDRAGGLDQQVGADDRERQDDRLDPARHDDRLDRRGAARPAPERPGRLERRSSDPARADVVLAAPACPKYARGADGALASARLTAILFVGDVVGSAGRRVLRTHARRPAHRAAARTSSSSTARTPSGGIGITPKHADELFTAGRRRDHARQPHLPAPRGLALPRGAPRDHPARQLPSDASPGAGPRSSSATASRSASSTSPATST